MQSWLSSLKAYFKKNLLLIFPLGLLAGIPYGMLVDPLNFWLSKSGVDRSTIGLLSLVFVAIGVVLTKYTLGRVDLVQAVYIRVYGGVVFCLMYFHFDNLVDGALSPANGKTKLRL